MNPEVRSILLWSLFGFLIISAVDGMILLLTNITFIAKLEAVIPFPIMQVSIRVTTLILYVVGVIMVLAKLKNIKGPKKFRFANVPIGFFVTLCIIAIFLPSLSNKLLGLNSEGLTSEIESDYV